jgi:putative effector of murein hydrolase LrgA (UPF0299 family)
MGIIFKAPGFLLFFVAGLWGLMISLQIVYELGGFVLAGIAFLLLPALLSLAPWYAGLVQGDWFPVALVYGGGIAAYGLIALGALFDDD